MGYGMQGMKGPLAGMKIGGAKVNQVPNFTPDQMKLFQSLFSHVGPESFLSRLAGGDQSQFDEMEAPALRQFSELQGNLASRFSGMGGLGARRSSGFQNTMNQATSDFAQDLQSKRKQMQMNALQELIGLSSNLLGQKPYDTFLTENKKRSFLQKLLGASAPVVGAGIGGFFGGPSGALVGSRAGSSFSQGLFG